MQHEFHAVGDVTMMVFYGDNNIESHSIANDVGAGNEKKNLWKNCKQWMQYFCEFLSCFVVDIAPTLKKKIWETLEWN